MPQPIPKTGPGSLLPGKPHPIESALDDGTLHTSVGSYTVATMLSSFSEATDASDMQIDDPPPWKNVGTY